MLNVEVGPTTGQHFQTTQALVDFYQEHAKLKSFSVLRRSLVKRGGESYKYVILSCDKNGKPRDRMSSKISGCRARVNVVLEDDGSYRIRKVVNEHDHELFPIMTMFMPAHRHIPNEMKRTLESND